MRQSQYRGYVIRLTSRQDLWFIEIRKDNQVCFAKDVDSPHANETSAYDWALYVIDQNLKKLSVPGVKTA